MRTPSPVMDARLWPPNYVEVLAWRQRQLKKLRTDPAVLAAALAFYKTHPVEFINHWCDTYDPRNAGSGRPTKFPFIMFKKQVEATNFIYALLEGQAPGLFEKARDMGVTWVACGVSVHLWLFWDGAAIGWGSRKEQYVDKIGDPDSIFEKLRILIRGLPREFLPVGFNSEQHLAYMKIVNPENGSTITGEAGDSIGRGGRKLIYFKDESAHYERPEKIESAVSDNTNVPIDISSVNGTGNVFHRKREAGIEWNGESVYKDRTNVFVMDWRDHPAKTPEWYNTRKKRMVSEGLGHLFAQEVDRDYSSSVEGIIIRPEWVDAAVDAHLVLGLPDEGDLVAGLDVKDTGQDKNALSIKRGIVVVVAKEVQARDTGELTRLAVQECSLHGAVEVNFDCIGVGAGVRAEANRLEDGEEMPQGIVLVPWSAASSPEDADVPIFQPVPDDRGVMTMPPTNRQYYANKKAQAWWRTARKFERTYRAVTYQEKFEPHELISLSSDDIDPLSLAQLKKELSQPTMGRTAQTMKLVVNKTPNGTRSPNLADSVVMADNPAAYTEPFAWYIDGELVA